jgi:putative nucleotidyltransferase with HDIG domain
MRKKISVGDARIGMFLHEVCGSWMEHPFWKKSFKLTTPKEIKTLQECGIQEIWIDTAKGLDVEFSVAAVSEEEQKRAVDIVLRKATSNAPIVVPRVALHEEIDRARKVHAKAKMVVVSMFHDVRMGKALQIGSTVELVDEIILSVSRNSDAFLNLARMKNKDNYTYLHSVAVCGLMISLGKQLGIDGDMLRSLGVAGLLHDAGKMLIPEKVLNKPGTLTEKEFDIMKAHPQLGWKILQATPEVNEVALDVCLHHHERMDGMGYPEKLSGDALTLFARMGAVCDVYDAITASRCYKQGWAPADSIRKMAEWQNGHFDLKVFHAFVKTVGIYPSGTLVKLKSGRLGVVTDQTENSLLTPIVKAFYSTRIEGFISPKLINLAEEQDAIEGSEDPVKWGFNMKMITGI